MKKIPIADNALPLNIAVYGTLKQGHGNHGLLTGERWEFYERNSLEHDYKPAEFLGVHRIHGYGLYSAWIPFAVPTEGRSIAVEVYRVVEPGMLSLLDRLEGHPRNYTRTHARTESGMQVQVYCRAKLKWETFGPYQEWPPSQDDWENHKAKVRL